MQIGSVTTPFGRRSAKLSLIRGQLNAGEINPERVVDKWRVFRDACEARAMLGLTDRALAVLNALLTFYPEKDLTVGAGLIVFPSNNQLSLRAHGIAGTTLRRHLAALVDAGLIIRHDSPNGKRYRRRDEAGDTSQAFGFSLAPLLSRAGELELLAASVVAERQTLRLLRERLTICRRDIRKLISAAMEEGASGDWGMIESHFLGLLSRIPRAAAASTITDVVDEMELLRDEVVNILEFQVKAEKTDGNDDQNGRHIQNSNPDYITESEPALEKEQGGETTVRWQKAIAGRGGDVATTIKAFPLGMVLRSCPEIAMYGPGGAISSWRDMMGAAIVVRSMLGVSPSAYQEACEVMGPENAATVIACILERAGHINSAGGYIRDLTAKARRGEFSLGPMLMSLMRAGAGAGAGTHQKAG